MCEQCDKLKAALIRAIVEADGCCDDEHGHPSHNLDEERVIAGLPPVLKPWEKEDR